MHYLESEIRSLPCRIENQASRRSGSEVSLSSGMSRGELFPKTIRSGVRSLREEARILEGRFRKVAQCARYLPSSWQCRADDAYGERTTKTH